MGQKGGIGIEIKLEESVSLRNVFIQVNGNGGKIQWRNTDKNNPFGGELIAENTMSAATYLKASGAIKTDTIVLWVPELPVTAKEYALVIANVDFNRDEIDAKNKSQK